MDDMEPPRKRSKKARSANITADEKMRLVRLIQRHGQAILSKTTKNTNADNKVKDDAWLKITDAFNSGGIIVRTSDTLKKLWAKMKSDAKTFKSTSKINVSGTGGGPGSFCEDPVLELVCTLTGRASSGISGIDDSDEMNAGVGPSFAEPSPMEADTQQLEYLEEFEVEVVPHVESTNQDELIIVESVVERVEENSYLHRRKPKISNLNERSEKVKAQSEMSNRFAAQRMIAEKEKIELIRQQQEQNKELHKMKMESEKIKQEIMLALLRRVTDADISEIGKILKES